MTDPHRSPNGLTSSELASIGGAVLFFGVASSLLNLFDHEFCILSWIDTWGREVGWIIRGAIIVAGLACRVVAYRQAAAERKAGQSADEPRDNAFPRNDDRPPRTEET